MVGGGIVGVATALALSKTGRRRVVVLEAEPRIASHQTGRNSGVIHSGLYYQKDSQKARFCTTGRDRLFDFCTQYEISHRRCGKLLLATKPQEIGALEALQKRGEANGLSGLQRLEPDEIRDREPAARGVAGLWVPQTGVVDFGVVTAEMARQVVERGGEIRTDARVWAIEPRSDRIRIATKTAQLDCNWLINCAGLQSDRVARMSGLKPEVRLVPFRGEYQQIMPPGDRLVRGLVYPVPDPQLPFLGVHLTRTIDQRVLVGPNAVLALKREGYARSEVSWRDVRDFVTFGGFWRLAARQWRTGISEMYRSIRQPALVGAIQRLIPELTADSLRPAPSGVRAQAIDRQGRLLDDFHILERSRMVHVLNAPSPAATASLAIADYLAGRVDSADYS